MFWIVTKSVTPWHPKIADTQLNSASRSLDSNLYAQAGCFLHLILLLDKLIYLNMAGENSTIMSDSDGDNASDEWFLSE